MATAKKTAKEKAPAAAPEQGEVVRSIKGFDKNFQCRGFQFEVGKTYEHTGTVKACSGGFHAIEGYPLEVFNYYYPGDGARYAEVTQGGDLGRHSGDSKIASARITIDAEIKIPELVARAFNWVLAQCVGGASKHTDGDRSASSATGNQSASSATGYQSASSATGDRSASSATGKAAVALNAGVGGRARAAEGGAIVVCLHDDDGNLVHIRAGKIGDNGLKPDTFYSLDEAGEFVEAA